jgi:hypothetical protein
VRAFVLAGLLAALAPAAAHATAQTPTPPLPPQGLYDECPPSSTGPCAEHLALMSHAGFRLDVNYEAWAGTATEVQAQASAAQADGIQLIWPLNAPAWRDPANATSLLTTYPLLAQTCGCTTNLGFEQYAVGLVRGDPATWGWYVGDELAPSQASAAQVLAGAVRALDPLHPTLYVASANTADPLANLEPFGSVAGVLGVDIYPIGQDVPASYVRPIAGDVSAVSRADHVRSAMILQAFSWAQYPTELDAPDPRWPTESEMRTMRDAALTADPAMILWYSFQDLRRSGAFARHWHDLVTAAFGPRRLARRGAASVRHPSHCAHRVGSWCSRDVASPPRPRHPRPVGSGDRHRTDRRGLWRQSREGLIDELR